MLQVRPVDNALLIELNLLRCRLLRTLGNDLLRLWTLGQTPAALVDNVEILFALHGFLLDALLLALFFQPPLHVGVFVTKCVLSFGTLFHRLDAPLSHTT